MELDVSVIKELIASLDSSGVDALRLETEGFKLALEKKGGTAVAAPAPQAAPARPAPPVQPAAPDAGRGNVITAPIVGTFYASPGPDKPAFVAVGQKVKKGDVLFIIESMKLMNEVASDYDGTVTEIIAESGQAVEYGTPVLRIE